MNENVSQQNVVKTITLLPPSFHGHSWLHGLSRKTTHTYFDRNVTFPHLYSAFLSVKNIFGKRHCLAYVLWQNRVHTIAYAKKDWSFVYCDEFLPLPILKQSTYTHILLSHTWQKSLPSFLGVLVFVLLTISIARKLNVNIPRDVSFRKSLT